MFSEHLYLSFLFNFIVSKYIRLLIELYLKILGHLLKFQVVRVAVDYTKALQSLSHINLLILDDFGVTPLKNDELNDLFEVVEDRTLSGSTIITDQLSVKEWHSYLGNATIADAMMDRLIYSAHRIEMRGESMRKVMTKR